MQTLNEIMSALDDTDLFVLFISDKALDSEWVARERLQAKKLLDQGKIRQIYPIIIDPDPQITHADERIPAWMRNEYVIRRITSPKIAAQKIKARLRELTWEMSPELKGRQTYFLAETRRSKNLNSEDPIWIKPRWSAALLPDSRGSAGNVSWIIA